MYIVWLSGYPLIQDSLNRIHCQGIARHVPIVIGALHFTVTCVGIDLGYFDFILGVDFLRTLGPILWDFDTMTMVF